MKITPRVGVALFAVPLLLLTACTADNAPAPTGDGVTLELWIGDRVTQAGMAATHDVVAEWEKETGNTVEIVENSFFELMNKMSVAIPAGEGPDAFMLTNNYIGQFAAQNLLAPVTLGEEQSAAFIDGAVSSFEIDGELYGVPLVADVNALVYNKALLKKVPDTFDALVDEALALTKDGNYGLLFPIDQFWSSFSFLAAEGGYIFGESDGAVDVDDLGLDNAGSIAGLEYLVDLVNDRGLMPADTTADVAQGLFTAGKVAAIIDGPLAIANFEAAGIEVGVAPIPSVAGGFPKPFATYTGLSMSIETEHAAETQALLNYLAEHLPGALQGASDGNISALAGAQTDSEQLQGWIAQLGHSYALPSVAEMNLVWGPASAAFTQAIHGQASAPAALAEAQQAIRDAIAAQ
ncbi:MAG TPA: extracellular solute-binding protein [Rhodoglobus sp.]|nr:extracellular solute-binding protein [Rhodoglobus sp.]HQA23017.1 extracellular solute-binding protein [Rhodoglobus sp.]HQE46905.1 extracellular solute-binding protein [Rhodoglobus sp.]